MTGNMPMWRDGAKASFHMGFTGADESGLKCVNMSL
jgi:hypothetical protein